MGHPVRCIRITNFLYNTEKKHNTLKFNNLLVKLNYCISSRYFKNKVKKQKKKKKKNVSITLG